MPQMKRRTRTVCNMNFDDAIRDIGQVGKYQIVMFCIIGMISFQTAIGTMNTVFIAAVPDHWCMTSELSHLNLSDDVIKNLTLPVVERDGRQTYSSCFRYQQNYSGWSLHDFRDKVSQSEINLTEEACPNGWRYDATIYTSTIVSEWDLVCENSWLRAAVSSVYMAGVMVGAIIFSSVSDIIGRRPTYIGTSIVVNILAVTISFAPNYTTFCVMRFFSGVFNFSAFTTGFVLVMELTGPDYRVHAGIGYGFFWSGAYMLFGLFAYLIRAWSKLILISSCAMLPLCFPIFLVPESPRWLYLQGYKSKADAVMEKMAKINGISVPQNLDIQIEKCQKGYIWDLFKTPNMARRTASLCFIWFVNSCVYYGLSLNTSNLGGNDFVNFVTSGAIEVPGSIMCLVVLQYGGRRWPQCATMVLGGVSLLCILPVPADLGWMSITLAMIGKFGISASFSITYVFTAELYPTVVRNIGVGSASFCARIGGILAPVINQLDVYSRFLPIIILGVLSISGGLLSLTLPETKNRNLPETLEDGENFGRKPSTNEGNTNVAFELNTESVSIKY